MLQEIRQNSRHAIIYVLFGILIAAFIISFGPHEGLAGGCGSSGSAYAAKVAGSTVSEADWKYGMVGLGFTRIRTADMRAQRVKEYVMDKLLEREILAREAERMGFRVLTDEAENLVKTGYVIILGHRFNVQHEIFVKDGGFKYSKFKNYARSISDTEKEFLGQQRKELLADKVRQLLKGSVLMSPEEVESHFKAENATVAFDFVRFAAAAYEKDVELKEGDVAAYLAAHEADVKAKYEKDKPLMYKGQPPEILTRHIRVNLAKDALPALVEAAKVKAEKLQERVTKGGEAFEAVAKSASDDDNTRRHGGDLRWRSDNMLGLGAEVDAAVKKAKPGEVTAAVRGDDGFEIIKIEKRVPAGDRSFDDVKLDIAENLALAAKAKELAKAAGDAALAKLLAEKHKQPTATLDVMFDHEQKGDSDMPPDVLKGLKLPPGVTIKSATSPGGPGGLQVQPTPAPEAPTPAPGAPAPGAPAPGAPEAPAPAAPTPATPAPGGGGGGKANPAPEAALPPWGALGRDLYMTQTAGTAPAKPAKPGKAPAKPAPAQLGVSATPPKPAPAQLGVSATPATAKPLGLSVTPSGGPAPETLPAPADATAAKPLPRDPSLPKIDEAGPMSRAETLQMEELGKSSAIVADLFDKLEAKTIAPTLYEAGDAFLIIYIRTKSKPDMDDFTKRKADIARNYQDNKSSDLYHQWIEAKCVELAKAKDISVNKSLVAYESETGGHGLESSYEACKSGALEH